MTEYILQARNLLEVVKAVAVRWIIAQPKTVVRRRGNIRRRKHHKAVDVPKGTKRRKMRVPAQNLVMRETPEDPRIVTPYRQRRLSVFH